MNRVSLFNASSFVKCNRAAIGSLLGTRTIFGDSYLNMEHYLNIREKVTMQLHGKKDQFTARIKNYLNSSTHGMIYSSDLKHMVHLAENNPEDLSLIIAMMKKFSKQNEELRFDSYTFGPVVMRMFYHLNVPDVVCQVLKDPELVSFFDQITSYTIAMTLLYNHGRYFEVLDLFDALLSRQFNAANFPREAMIIMSAACYKLNTSESLQRIIKVLQNAKEADALILRKVITFAAGLALKQNQPIQALEILSLTKQENYFTIKNLKVIALVQLDRIDDALMIIRRALQRDVPDANKKTTDFSEETIAIVKDALEQADNKELLLEFQRMEQVLKDYQYLTKETIDETLCAPILQRPTPRRNSRTDGFESRFFLPPNRVGSGQRLTWPQRQRQGLLDVDE